MFSKARPMLNSSWLLESNTSMDDVERRQNILENNIDPPRHQNKRTASRSISPRNIGCKLARVVTSTFRRIVSCNRRCTLARSSSENRASGATSTKTSTSLSNLASPRAVDPNRYAASTPRARNASAFEAISARAWLRVMVLAYTKFLDCGMRSATDRVPSTGGSEGAAAFL